jgi:uncharacterized MAPEG superfamily protein
MTIELTMLAWTLVLAIVQIFLPSYFRTRETGIDYNVSARDQSAPVPVGPITGRLMRAQQNLMESLPIFIAVVLMAQVLHLHNGATAWGATLYFIARMIYVPLYAFGIPFIRTLVWLTSMLGIFLLLGAILL